MSDESLHLVLVLSTAPDRATAERLAHALVTESLAACVNILAPCRSVYRWQGEVCSEEEWPMLIKTPSDRLDALCARLRALHPYEVPEIVTFAASSALPDYLAWAVEQTRPLPGTR